MKKSGTTTTQDGNMHFGAERQRERERERERSSLQLVATSRCTKPRQGSNYHGTNHSLAAGLGDPNGPNALDVRCLSRKFDSGCQSPNVSKLNTQEGLHLGSNTASPPLPVHATHPRSSKI